MNNLSIALLTVAVIVIAAWLAGWLPSWLASRLPESPLRHEGFEAPPAAVDPEHPTEVEVLAYLKYGMLTMSSPVSTTELEAAVKELESESKINARQKKQYESAFRYLNEVWIPHITSLKLDTHPIYKTVMESTSVKEIKNRLLGVYKNNDQSTNILNTLIDSINRLPMTPELRLKYLIDGPLDEPSESLFRLTDYYCTEYVKGLIYNVCHAPMPEKVFGPSTAALCSVDPNSTITNFKPLDRFNDTITAFTHTLSIINLAIRYDGTGQPRLPVIRVRSGR